MSGWLYLIASYVAAFLLGGYTHATVQGQSVELHRWVLTMFFGGFFFLQSRMSR